MKNNYINIISILFILIALTACTESLIITKNIRNNIMTVSDHLRAVQAMDAKNLNAAQGYLTGKKYDNRYRPISNGESWASIQYRAAKIVADADAKGQSVQNDALYLAYISLFEAEEGLPDRPDIMLEYMHKAMEMLIKNPRLLDNIDSKNVSAVPSMFVLKRYAIWQYLYDGGEVDWTKKPQKNDGQSIAGESYRTWNIKIRKAIWNRGDIFLQGANEQFIHDTLDYSQFPVVACVARKKGWKLTLPVNYQEQNFRAGGRFDWASCKSIN